MGCNLVPEESDCARRRKHPKVSEVLRVEEALDGFVQGNAGGDEDREDDREARELLAPEAAEEERDSERHGRERVAEVVDQVSEKRDRVRSEEDRELSDRGEAENRKAQRNCLDAFARANDRAVDESVRMAVIMRVVVGRVNPVCRRLGQLLGLAKAETKVTMGPDVRVDVNPTSVTMWHGCGGHSARRSRRA